jgi:hypothetical protein
LKLLNVAIHNKNGKGLLQIMNLTPHTVVVAAVAIHNKNGKGLLPSFFFSDEKHANGVAIHNKNGKGLLLDKTVKGYIYILSRNPQ